MSRPSFCGGGLYLTGARNEKGMPEVRKRRSCNGTADPMIGLCDGCRDHEREARQALADYRDGGEGTAKRRGSYE